MTIAQALSGKRLSKQESTLHIVCLLRQRQVAARKPEFWIAQHFPFNARAWRKRHEWKTSRIPSRIGGTHETARSIEVPLLHAAVAKGVGLKLDVSHNYDKQENPYPLRHASVMTKPMHHAGRAFLSRL